MTHDVDPRVLVRRQGTVGRISLDRPEAINALNIPMVLAMQQALDAWREDPAVSVVLIDGRGERGFCAGGDIRFVHRSITEDRNLVLRLWQAQYRLDVCVAEYPKPVVTIADGVTMGGGMGLASHASHRVATRRSVFGMPEVGIGLAPDVGGLFLFSHAPGETGTHAALAGVTLNAADALCMGLADYVLRGEDIAGLVAGLQGSHPTPLLAALHSAEEAGAPAVLTQRTWIDECYADNDVASIVRALEQHADPRAQAAAEVLLAGSPTALAVTLEALRRAATMGRVRECFRQDYRVSSRFLEHPDLLEGIRARLVDKDQTPHWEPPDLGSLDLPGLQGFFEPLAEEVDLDGR